MLMMVPIQLLHHPSSFTNSVCESIAGCLPRVNPGRWRYHRFVSTSFKFTIPFEECCLQCVGLLIPNLANVKHSGCSHRLSFKFIIPLEECCLQCVGLSIPNLATVKQPGCSHRLSFKFTIPFEECCLQCIGLSIPNVGVIEHPGWAHFL